MGRAKAFKAPKEGKAGKDKDGNNKPEKASGKASKTEGVDVDKLKRKVDKMKKKGKKKQSSSCTTMIQCPLDDVTSIMETSVAFLELLLAYMTSVRIIYCKLAAFVQR